MPDRDGAFALHDLRRCVHFLHRQQPDGAHAFASLGTPDLAYDLLLSSSITVSVAERALKGGRVFAFNLWTGATVLLGLEFLRQTALELRQLIVDWHLTIATNLFGTTFHSLVGLHASHVVVGGSLRSISRSKSKAPCCPRARRS
jgi:heme/copper-type cytochrome/quinol oxidase subunit 3